MDAHSDVYSLHLSHVAVVAEVWDLPRRDMILEELIQRWPGAITTARAIRDTIADIEKNKDCA